jgi:hypothetical protein
MEFATIEDFKASDNYIYWYNTISSDYQELTTEEKEGMLFNWWNDTKNGIVINGADQEVPKPLTTVQNLEYFGLDLYNAHYSYLIMMVYP